ncbi:MAG TPA: DUF1127 domain-containing protein [Alphaproteobacteria bacterium]
MHTMLRREDLSRTPPRLAALLHKLHAVILRGAIAVCTWQARATERAHLAELSDRLLKDVGLSRADIEREVQKPFWEP